MKLICNYKRSDGVDRVIVQFAEVIRDFNLISNHILVSLHAMLSIDNDVKLEVAEPAAVNGDLFKRPTANSQMAQEDPHAHLSGISRFEAILKDLFADLRQEKVSEEQIKTRLNRKFTEGETKQFITQLVSNGALSDSTINEKKYYELL